MSIYGNYYQRTINTDEIGYKSVLGGTGLGKTSGIPEVVEKNPEKKFIYIANRKQLLDELEEKFNPGQVVKQRRDAEILADVKLQKAIRALFTHDLIKAYHDFLSRKKLYSKPLIEILNAYQRIVENHHFLDQELGREIIEGEVRKVMGFFKLVLRTCSQIQKGEFSVKNEPSLSPRDYDELIHLEGIRVLFPYLDFKNHSERRIFLVTLHKAFFGFFDGHKNVNLYKLDNEGLKNAEAGNGGYVIFMDEFDFLENDLLSLIVSDIEIDLPFEFVERFYVNMKDRKLTTDKFLANHGDIRREVEAIIAYIGNLKEEYEIPFPEINHFVCMEDVEKIKNKSIFQTRFTMSSKPLYLDHKVREGSFDLRTKRTYQKASAFTLLDVVNQSVARIINLFKELEYKYPNAYSHLVRSCYGSSDLFKRQLRRVKQYPRKRKRVATNQDKLFYDGFGLYEIQDLQNETDIDEVAFHYYAIFSTPEKVLLHLIRHNLVFGLSATSNIRRVVRNFDLRWLKEESNELFLPLTADDQAEIAYANALKQKARNNRLQFMPATDMSCLGQLSEFIEGIVRFNRSDEKGEVFGADRKEYRRNRLKYLFALLSHLKKCRSPQEMAKDTHLLFFNSLRQIRYLLEQEAGGGEDELYQVQKQQDEALFTYYRLCYQGQEFNLILFEASTARQMYAADSQLQAYYQVFEQDVPVLLLTTYPSAGNGVNLQYYSSKAVRLQALEQGQDQPDCDFKSAHLVDSPYYFFSPLSEQALPQENHAITKKNLYYLAKLCHSKGITHAQFMGQLGGIRNISSFNNEYLKSRDGVLNRLSVFVQALGRIERVWQQMEDQQVYLSNESLAVFETFLSEADYAAYREAMAPYLSANLSALLEQIKKHMEQKGLRIEQLAEEGLQQKDSRSRNAVRQILAQLQAMREGRLSKSLSQKVRKEWGQLRRLALQHDFKALQQGPYRKFAATFETDYLEKGKVWIHPESRQLVPQELGGAGFEQWDLNSLYAVLSENFVVHNHFEVNSYELGFGAHGFLFTPYFHQAILAGAIGEEVVKALLTRPREYDELGLRIGSEHTSGLLRPFIQVSEKDIPDALFEVADLKVKDKPFFIDCKNYSERTIRNFQLTEEDPLYHAKLNEGYFKESALNKLKLIRQQYPEAKDDCKLIYINAFGMDDKPKVYLNEKFEDVGFDFEKAQIIFIHGIINRQHPNLLLSGFKTLLEHLNQSVNHSS